ncbi:MAG TPA: outer membrane beta-barrel protein [Steroidobacteraceae bacterium]|nr:outer membrane beta-barrel protein [Steroidobacteraceae bacterium]
MRVAIIAFIALAGSAAVTTAGAAELGVYAGVSYAMVKKDSTRSVFENEAAAVDAFAGFIPDPATITSSFDDEDSSYGFVVGWRMSEHFAFEGGYMDLGEVKYRRHASGVFVSDPPGPGTFQQNIDSGTSGIQLSALAILPLTYRWEVYARGGVLIANNTENLFVLDEQGTGGKARATKSGFDLLGGVGVSFSVAEIYNIRLEYQRVFDAGDDATLDAADVDLMSLNVSVSF